MGLVQRELSFGIFPEGRYIHVIDDPRHNPLLGRLFNIRDFSRRTASEEHILEVS